MSVKKDWVSVRAVDAVNLPCGRCLFEGFFRHYEGCIAVMKRGRTAPVRSEMLELAIEFAEGYRIYRICELH
jgi:hypothetical protein